MGDPGVDGRDLQKVGCGGMNWIDLAQHRVMNLRVPYNAENFVTS